MECYNNYLHIEFSKSNCPTSLLSWAMASGLNTPESSSVSKYTTTTNDNYNS